jgi:hypothetical protein
VKYILTLPQQFLLSHPQLPPPRPRFSSGPEWIL